MDKLSNTENSCDQCYFYYTDEGEKNGTCLRFPPQMTRIIDDEPEYEQPKVIGDYDLCGEFKRIKKCSPGKRL
jgi:hypothetical protein